MTRAKNADQFLNDRFEVEKLIRQFFWSIQFTEVRTPLLVLSPGMEPHIRPIEVKNTRSLNTVFLPTSPEFGMKKLIARGFENIFQICSSFRDEPTSPEHHPEFTLLEFYESNTSIENFQARIESLFLFLAINLHKKEVLEFRGEKFNLQNPWPRFRIPDLFEKFADTDLRTHQTSAALAGVCKRFKISASESEAWDDLYFKIWLNEIEPKLPKDKLFFVTHYPVSQSSLCNRTKDEQGFEWASRFEVYAGRLELGNAFDELRDPAVQRKNFLHDQKIRQETYQGAYPESPIDEELLEAISAMPPTCGIAIGVDRLSMLLLNAPNIDSVIGLKSHWS